MMFTVYEPELRLVRRHGTCFQSSLITGVFRETLGPHSSLICDGFDKWAGGVESQVVRRFVGTFIVDSLLLEVIIEI